jgi:hypothetical protein
MELYFQIGTVSSKPGSGENFWPGDETFSQLPIRFHEFLGFANARPHSSLPLSRASRGTRMNFVAEEEHCLMVYSAQPSQANQAKCWNWFRTADHG